MGLTFWVLALCTERRSFMSTHTDASRGSNYDIPILPRQARTVAEQGLPSTLLAGLVFHRKATQGIAAAHCVD